MRHDPTFWILARAAGLVAYVLLTASVLAGLVLKTKALARLARPAIVTEVHRFLAVLGLGAIALHGVTLVLDRTVRMPLAALVVPGISPYRPLPVALGVVAAELMLVVYLSFGLRRRIGFRGWRRLHWATYGVFAAGTVHGIAAGTDSSRPTVLALYALAVGVVAGVVGWRALTVPTTGGTRRVPDRARPQPL